MEMEGSLEHIQKHSFFLWLQEKKNYFIVFLLGLIAWFGFYIRTRNIPLLIDATTGQYIPSDPDAIGILRYVQYVVEHGQLMSVDYMRYYPTGFSGLEEFGLLTHLIAWFYHIYSFFVPSVSVAYADVVFPAFAFILTAVFFFLFVQKVFDWKIALLASAFLAVIPAFLDRTMSGVSDKEAMAMMFFFLTLYLFLCFILEKKFWKSFLYVLGAAVSGACLWLLWGGFVFVFLTIGSFILTLVFLERISLRQLLLYGLFFLIPLVVLKIFNPARYDFWGLVMTPAIGMMFFALVLGFVHYILFVKDAFALRSKLHSLPHIFFSIAVVIFLGLFWLALYYGPSVLFGRIAYTFHDFIDPFSATRWSITVAENFQPFFRDILYSFGWQYLVVAFLGGMFLFYHAFSSLGKKAYILTGFYSFSLLGIVLSRYAPGSVLDGESFISVLFFVGSLVCFFAVLVYVFIQLYRKDREAYTAFLSQFPLRIIFFLILFFFLLLGARSAIRLIFVFAPMTTVLLAYFVFRFFQTFQQVQAKAVHMFAFVVIFLLVGLLFVNSSQATLSFAEGMGSVYTLQWQYAMDWVRENTPEDAVFAQWWDYGYFIQTFGERATLSDGGNAQPGINYFVARHFLTAQNDTEALEFLAAKNVSHVLVISQDINIYPAFSSIGSDAEFDRFSWILASPLNPSQSQETRNGTKFVYSSSILLDEDLIVEDIIFPAYSAFIASITVPVVADANGTLVAVEQPEIQLLINGNSYQTLSVRCVFYDGKEVLFEDADIESCVQIIPSYDGATLNPLGAVIYLSPRTWHSWIAQHYLFDVSTSSFEQVYSDKNELPVMYYNGKVVGSLKIWKVHYPENLTIPEAYYGTSIPEGVDDLGISEKYLLN